MQKDECVRCGHTWYRRNPEMPLRCPKCKNTKWNQPPIYKKIE